MVARIGGFLLIAMGTALFVPSLNEAFDRSILYMLPPSGQLDVVSPHVPEIIAALVRIFQLVLVVAGGLLLIRSLQKSDNRKTNA